jgi:hypothetical protein
MCKLFAETSVMGAGLEGVVLTLKRVLVGNGVIIEPFGTTLFFLGHHLPSTVQILHVSTPI